MSYSRRRFVQGVGVAGLALVAGCGRLPWQAQPPAKAPRIGFLGAPAGPYRQAFDQGLRELGYVEGQNIVVETRFEDARTERLPGLAAELVSLPVDVIVAPGEIRTRAALNATSMIPIVTIGFDPLRSGLVASLARPEGNVTGVSQVHAQLAGKRLELLKQALPALTRVGILMDASVRERATVDVRETEAAAQALGVQVHTLLITEVSDLEGVFEVATREHADALIMLTGLLVNTLQARIAELALQHHLPMMFAFREFADAGGLMTYGTSNSESYRRAATYVDRILKGAKPADLPIEQPTKFDFVINLRTAQALGLSIPPHVLLQATELIQ